MHGWQRLAILVFSFLFLIVGAIMPEPASACGLGNRVAKVVSAPVRWLAGGRRSGSGFVEGGSQGHATGTFCRSCN